MFQEGPWAGEGTGQGKRLTRCRFQDTPVIVPMDQFSGLAWSRPDLGIGTDSTGKQGQWEDSLGSRQIP